MPQVIVPVVASVAISAAAATITNVVLLVAATIAISAASAPAAPRLAIKPKGATP